MVVTSRDYTSIGRRRRRLNSPGNARPKTYCMSKTTRYLKGRAWQKLTNGLAMTFRFLR
jgi:hypothetical protein